MRLSRKRLQLSALLTFVATAACSLPSSIDSPPADAPPAHLTLRVKGWDMDLDGREVNLVPNDSLRLHAFVENRPDAYSTPVISASDPTILEPLSDGTYNVRHFGTLNLTATALAKSPSQQPQVLTATAKINLACTAEMRPGIVLTVLDSVSGAPMALERTRRVRATSASRVDSVAVLPSGSLILGGVIPIGDGRWGFAMENPGIWSVEVEVEGHRAWRQDGIAVSRGLCHVITTNVAARLGPL